jgi:hypothetical protein
MPEVTHTNLAHTEQLASNAQQSSQASEPRLGLITRIINATGDLLIRTGLKLKERTHTETEAASSFFITL